MRAPVLDTSLGEIDSEFVFSLTFSTAAMRVRFGNRGFGDYNMNPMTDTKPQNEASNPQNPSQRQRVLTGDTPTGSLHLGHYVGSIENRLQMQDEYDCFFFVANWHALTTRVEQHTEIRADTINIVKDWLSCGIDPNKATLFVHSEVPAIAELTWYFGMLVGYGRLMRNPTINEEIKVKLKGEEHSFGFLMYPVGQIADILAFRPAFVPVGEDQVPHIEMTREVARRFNQLYCGIDTHIDDDDPAHENDGVFPIPAAKIGRIARLTGTDGVNKMSKSLGNAILLSDTPKQVKKKCNKIFTGRGSMDDPPVIEGNTVLEYLDIFVDKDIATKLRESYANGEAGDGVLKKQVGESINAFLDPIRERRESITDGDVIDVLKAGTEKANAVAEQTLWQAKQALTWDFFPRELKLK
jgi:tryptophanyl-tRNA synthetase